MASTTARLLCSLEQITHETREMLSAIDESDSVRSHETRHELKRRIFEIRTVTHELTEWLGEVRLEEPTN